MEKNNKSADSDIAKESYKGPSSVAAGAGEGFVAHLKWGLLLLAMVGIPAAIFHKTSDKALNVLRSWSRRGVEKEIPTIFSTDAIHSAVGKITLGLFGHGKADQTTIEAFEHLEVTTGIKGAPHWRQQHENGLGLWVLNHTIGLIPPVRKWLFDVVEKHESVKNGIAAGGPFGFFGYFILPIFMFGKGAEKGVSGRRQFEHAKDEIWDLRAENDLLRQRNGELRAEVNDIKTTLAAEANKLQVSKDDPPVIRDTAAAPGAPAMGNSTVAQTVAQHETAVHKESPTKIEAPKIEPPKQWWDETEQHTTTIERTASELGDSPNETSPSKPAAPRIEGGKASKVEHRADREWGAVMKEKQAAAEAAAHHPALV